MKVQLAFSFCVLLLNARLGMPQEQTVPSEMTGLHVVLPNGREIMPAGRWIAVAPYPFAMALKRDGSEAAVPSIGFPFALNVIAHPDEERATVRRMPTAITRYRRSKLMLGWSIHRMGRCSMWRRVTRGR